MPRPIALAAAAAAFLACVPSPQKSYTVAEIGQITSLEEVMRVKAHYVDPLFAVRDEEAFSEEQLAQMIVAASYLEATSSALEGKLGEPYDEGFGAIAGELKAKARELRGAAEAQDAAAAGATLRQIKGLCGQCHRAYR